MLFSILTNGNLCTTSTRTTTDYSRGGGGGATKREGGHVKFYPYEKGGAQKVSDPRFTHFVAPPSPYHRLFL